MKHGQYFDYFDYFLEDNKMTICPHCGKTLNAHLQQTGQSTKCNNCKSTLTLLQNNTLECVIK